MSGLIGVFRIQALSTGFTTYLYLCSYVQGSNNVHIYSHSVLLHVWYKYMLYIMWYFMFDTLYLTGVVYLIKKDFRKYNYFPSG